MDASVSAALDSDDGRGGGRSSPWPFIEACAGCFMVILDAMVMNLATPALSQGLRGLTTGLQ
ncbi:MAG: hypothetical protein M0T80_01045 [Actinomycetota bacterium]|nr:hypothetical protein [Actinomycetota bacterium]